MPLGKLSQHFKSEESVTHCKEDDMPRDSLRCLGKQSLQRHKIQSLGCKMRYNPKPQRNGWDAMGGECTDRITAKVILESHSESND